MVFREERGRATITFHGRGRVPREGEVATMTCYRCHCIVRDAEVTEGAPFPSTQPSKTRQGGDEEAVLGRMETTRRLGGARGSAEK